MIANGVDTQMQLLDHLVCRATGREERQYLTLTGSQGFVVECPSWSPAGKSAQSSIGAQMLSMADREDRGRELVGTVVLRDYARASGLMCAQQGRVIT